MFVILFMLMALPCWAAQSKGTSPTACLKYVERHETLLAAGESTPVRETAAQWLAGHYLPLSLGRAATRFVMSRDGRLVPVYLIDPATLDEEGDEEGVADLEKTIGKPTLANRTKAAFTAQFSMDPGFAILEMAPDSGFDPEHLSETLGKAVRVRRYEPDSSLHKKLEVDAIPYEVALSPDSQMMVTVTGAGHRGPDEFWQIFQLYRLEKQEGPIALFIGSHHHVNSLAFSEDGKRLVVLTSHDGGFIWNIEDPYQPSPMIQFGCDVGGICLVKDLESVHSEGMLVGQPVKEGTKVEWGYLEGSLSPNARFIAVNGFDNKGRVEIWDLKDKRQVSVPESYAQYLAFAGTDLVFCGGGMVTDNKAIREREAPAFLLDVSKNTRIELEDLPAMNRDRVLMESLTTSSDGKLLAAGFSSGNVVVWSAETKEVVMHGEPQKNNAGLKPLKTPFLSFSPDGKHLLSLDGENKAILWEVASGKVIYYLAASEMSIRELMKANFMNASKALESAEGRSQKGPPQFHNPLFGK